LNPFTGFMMHDIWCIGCPWQMLNPVPTSTHWQ